VYVFISVDLSVMSLVRGTELSESSPD